MELIIILVGAVAFIWLVEKVVVPLVSTSWIAFIVILAIGILVLLFLGLFLADTIKSLPIRIQ